MDNLTKAERSVLMSHVRSKHSRAELFVRSLVHRMGFRYRLHSPTLPGTHDLVFPGRQKLSLFPDVFDAGIIAALDLTHPRRIGDTGTPSFDCFNRRMRR